MLGAKLLPSIIFYPLNTENKNDLKRLYIKTTKFIMESTKVIKCSELMIQVLGYKNCK